MGPAAGGHPVIGWEFGKSYLSTATNPWPGYPPLLHISTRCLENPLTRMVSIHADFSVVLMLKTVAEVNREALIIH